MSAEPDLLPCPWCGEKLANVSVSEGSTFRWRKVDGCCADGPEVRHHTMADDQEAAEIESRAAAINAWNRRACVSSATEALRAEVGSERRLRIREEGLSRAWKARADFAEKGLNECAGRAARAEHRAERLAEALRGIETKLVHSMDHARSSLERKRAMSECADAARAAIDQARGKGGQEVGRDASV